MIADAAAAELRAGDENIRRLAGAAARTLTDGAKVKFKVGEQLIERPFGGTHTAAWKTPRIHVKHTRIRFKTHSYVKNKPNLQFGVSFHHP